MNCAQAKRIALAVMGSNIVLGEVPDCVTNDLSQKDFERLQKEYTALGWSLLQRAGFDEAPMGYEIVGLVLKGKP